jgi:hypothetical protein
MITRTNRPAVDFADPVIELAFSWFKKGKRLLDNASCMEDSKENFRAQVHGTIYFNHGTELMIALDYSFDEARSIFFEKLQQDSERPSSSLLHNPLSVTP